MRRSKPLDALTAERDALRADLRDMIAVNGLRNEDCEKLRAECERLRKRDERIWDGIATALEASAARSLKDTS